MNTLLKQGGTAMQDMQAYLEKLHRDAIDCAVISRRPRLLRLQPNSRRQ
jgi:hypothetical protein